MTSALGGRGGAAGVARSNVYGASVLAVGAAFVKTTQAASDLNEEITRSQVVFGSSAEAINSWAKTTATSFGISEREALRAASSYGAMLRTIGNTPVEAERMSRVLVELAGDLSSFNNQDPTEMLDRLRSGLAGEIEPLRQFGILLSESRVKAEAYATGIAKAGAKLTEQQKVQARYQILLKDSALAQGDFARTSENLANQQRILRAQLLNLEASIGKVLLPTMIVLVSTANDLITGFEAAGSAAETLTEKVGGLGGVLSNVLSQIPGLTAGVAAIEAARRIGGRGGAAAPLVRGESAADKAAISKGFVTPSDVRRARIAADLRNQWFDAMLGRREDRVQDIRSAAGQIAELRQIAKLIEARIAITKDITRRLTLEDELLGVQRQIRGVQAESKARTEALRAEAKQLAEERRERAKAARERARLARETDLFRRLGLGPGGNALVPGVPALQRRLGRISEAVKGTVLDTGAMRKRLATLASVIRDAWGDAGREVRREIERMLADIDRKLADRGEQRTRFRHVASDTLLAGLGLSPNEMRALRLRLAQLGPGGVVPGGSSRAFAAAGAGTMIGTAHFYGVTDVREMERQLSKRDAARPHNRRGAR